MADGKPASVEWSPGDWMKDPAVRACSLAARGLWFDLLMYMFEAADRGYLKHPGGQPFTADQVARMVGAPAPEVSALLLELEGAEVFSRTPDGVIYSRRIVRDEWHRRQAEPAAVVAKPARSKGRDELFDTIAEVTGRDPRTNGSVIAKVAKQLRQADPPYTPDEVREFGVRFWEFCPWAARDDRKRPTPTEVPNHIGLLRAAPALVDEVGAVAVRKPAGLAAADKLAEALRRPSGGANGKIAG